MGMLDGRVIVLTGSGRGIGAATAKLLAAEGASVVVNDLGVALDGTEGNVGPAQELVNEITAAGGSAVANTDDIADYDAAGNLIQQAITEFGKLDVVVNVAGILRDRMIFNLSPEDWQSVLNVHLNGTFNTSKHASVYWREQRNAEAQNRIINFTSVSGQFGAPGQPNYAAAKMGIIGLTYSCANALGRYGVTTNAISPAAATRMVGSIPDERRKEGSTDADAMSPDHVARVVAYIASERSGWLNGQVIGSAGPKVTLYNKPAALQELISVPKWELDELTTQMEKVFKPTVSGTGR
ncbi:MAG: SDR family oxidoreductase [Microthrixaceae bacterium]|nr:SDR family oxidoreductase [Microthrixaceae bacterium]